MSGGHRFFAWRNVNAGAASGLVRGAGYGAVQAGMTGLVLLWLMLLGVRSLVGFGTRDRRGHKRWPDQNGSVPERDGYRMELVDTITARRRLSALGNFRRALCSGQIIVHYQPIVSVEDLSVCGAEALVRWEHPRLGRLGPPSFIHMVERTGMIAPLTRHVLERSVAECTEWRRSGRELSVSVNLSARNLLDRSLPGDVARVLDGYGLAPDALQLELTESMIILDPGRALSTVARLKELGVRLSVDDFGTGYSSLSNLKRLPIDQLKIDRSFVSLMASEESDRIIVRSTINLAHDLGLGVVAEGVEDQRTLGHLTRMGCDLIQGYHVSRPIPREAFRRWLDMQPAPSAAGS
jgi:EAL domain-containing protein (putative c-di-GMP-specific phosphodiesterase class I)